MTIDRFKQFKEMMGQLYVDICKGEFTFPEFAGKSKKHQKECSLKAYSILQRYARQLEGTDDDKDDQRQTS
jgi:hypothetical protein